MISDFIQKALLKVEKSCSILVKDEFLKNEILSGTEINDSMLQKIYSKENLKRKDFTRIEEMIKIDLDEKIAGIEETNVLYDIISEDFKRYDKATIKTKLLKKEYLYITGKTLYEHLINKKENSLEQTKQNRLLLFLNIPPKDWNFVESLTFEKYFRIPTMYFYAAFARNAENVISKSMLVFNDTFEKVEFTIFDNDNNTKTKFEGTGSGTIDFYRFEFEDEKRHSPVILFIPKLTEHVITGNIFSFESPKRGFVSDKIFLLKVKEVNQVLEILKEDQHNNMAGNCLCNNLPSFQGYDYDFLNIQPQTAIFNSIAGQYVCYTIGKEKDRIRSQKLVIKKDCSVQFSSSNLHVDFGYANVSDEDKILQIHFHPEEGEFKYNIFLYLNNSDIREGKLQGVVCGINRLNEPFAERVFVVKEEDEAFEPEDYKIGTDKLNELLKEVPELLQIFLGEINDFSTDFGALQMFYKDFYLPKKQNISRISGVFEVFSFDPLRTCIRKSALQINPNGDIQLKLFEKGQTFSGKCEILEPDVLIIRIFKGTANSSFYGFMVSLINGFDIDGIQNLISFFTGKNEKNELVSVRQVCIKSENEYDTINPEIIAFNSPEFENMNKKFGLGQYLSGRTNNILRAELSINHSLKPKNDYARLYFESACFSAIQLDKTRALQQLENAFNHGFKNKEMLQKELNESLKPIADMVDVEKLKVLF